LTLDNNSIQHEQNFGGAKMTKNSNKACFSCFNRMIFQDKTRQDKTRQDKTRQDKTRQDKTLIFSDTLQNISRVFHGIFLLFF